METICEKCNGFIGEPGRAYGYAGKWCHCPNPFDYIKPIDLSILTDKAGEIKVEKTRESYIAIPISMVMEIYAELTIVNTDRKLADKLLEIVKGNNQ